jgi:methanogenic corrinoid protein MtbC1
MRVRVSPSWPRQSLGRAGLANQVKVIIGGAPVTQQYADSIGASGYTDNASAAVALARALCAA